MCQSALQGPSRPKDQEAEAVLLDPMPHGYLGIDAGRTASTQARSGGVMEFLPRASVGPSQAVTYLTMPRDLNLSLRPLTDGDVSVAAAKELWLSVLRRGVLDSRGEVWDEPDPKVKKKIQRSARRWLRSRSERVGSYRWIVNQFNLDDDWLRRQIAEDVAFQGWPRRAA